MGTTLPNGLYNPADAETGWGDEVRNNFSLLDPLLDSIGGDRTYQRAMSSATHGKEWASFPVYMLDPPTGSATTDTANLRAALNIANNSAVHIIAAPGQYLLNPSTPFTYYSHTWLQGAGWADSSMMGTTFRRSGSMSSGRAIFEPITFQTNAVDAQGRGISVESCMFSDFAINGQDTTNGNALFLYGPRNHVHHVWIENFAGTTTDNGEGIVGRSLALNGSTVVVGAENCCIQECRLHTLRSGIHIGAGGDQYTDGYLQDNEFLKPRTHYTIGSVARPDIWMQQTGGWFINANHCNGSLGEFILADSVAGAWFINNFVDGWGGNSALGVGGISISGCSSFDGGSGAIIANNHFRHRVHQNTTDYPGGTWSAIKVNPGSLNFDTQVNIYGNQGWRRTNSPDNDGFVGPATASANYFLDLRNAGSSGATPATVNYLVHGNNPVYYYNGTVPSGAVSGPYSDATIFQSAMSGTRMTVRGDNNSWNYVPSGGARPLAGNWHSGMKRWLSNPSSNGSMGEVCVASGTPGTWRSMPVLLGP